MAACCYFGVDLRNGLDHYTLSRFSGRDSLLLSDLPYFTLLLYLDKITLSPNSSSLSSLDKKKFWAQFYKNILRQFQIVS